MAIFTVISKRFEKYYEKIGEAESAREQRISTDAIADTHTATVPLAIYNTRGKDVDGNREIRFFCIDKETIEAEIYTTGRASRKALCSLKENQIFINGCEFPFHFSPLNYKKKILNDIKNYKIELDISKDGEGNERIEALRIITTKTINLSKKQFPILVIAISLILVGSYLIYS